MARGMMTALVTQAMEDLALGMVVELGYESLYEPAADDACPSDADIAHALKEPVSMAAVMQDLCWVLGIALQGVVALVLDGPGRLASGYQTPQNRQSSGPFRRV